jgi:threonine/homoserine/homoserine lactone efflux protein
MAIALTILTVLGCILLSFLAVNTVKERRLKAEKDKLEMDLRKEHYKSVTQLDKSTLPFYLPEGSSGE